MDAVISIDRGPAKGTRWEQLRWLFAKLVFGREHAGPGTAGHDQGQRMTSAEVGLSGRALSAGGSHTLPPSWAPLMALIRLMSVGSRGVLQPYLAILLELQRRGHAVELPVDFQTLLASPDAGQARVAGVKRRAAPVQPPGAAQARRPAEWGLDQLLLCPGAPRRWGIPSTVVAFFADQPAWGHTPKRWPPVSAPLPRIPATPGGPRSCNRPLRERMGWWVQPPAPVGCRH